MTTDKPSAGAKTIADKLMALRSALNPTKHQFVWDEMTTLADDINRLAVMPEKLSPDPPVAGAEVGVREATIEECAVNLARWYPDNASLNAFCAALRSMKTARAVLSPPVAERGGGDQTLRELVEFWIYDGRLQTFEDRERFRKAARAALGGE